MAYMDIKKDLGKRQLYIYDIIKKLGCPTNLEISKFSRLPINQVTPRTNELVKHGMVIEHEKRNCSISGRIVMTWRVNDDVK